MSTSSTQKLMVDPATVFMTIGPTACGKSTFCTQYLVPSLPGKVKYLSSDTIRYELLEDDNVGKYDPEMTAISHQAFEQLFSRLTTYMAWPCSADFIVIDSTGLNKKFRKQVADLCREKAYSLLSIVFDYKSYQSYYKHAIDKAVVTTHIETLRKSVLPVLHREMRGHRIFTLRHQHFDRVKVKVPTWDNYQKCFLTPNTKVIIIADVNGCYDELLLLLKQFKIDLDENGMLNSHSKIILLGQTYRPELGKNGKLRSLVETNNLILVNEENLPFVSVKNRWIATPRYYDKKYLGKLGEIPICPLDFKDAVFNEPYRILGGHPITGSERKDNIWAIDGGCVHGGNLIGLTFNNEGRPFLKRQAALKTYVTGTLHELFPKGIDLITEDELSPPLRYRHYKIIHSGAPFLSGTMAPAPVDIKADITPEAFESLAEALKYYKRNGIEQVCLQPKYMGSRCTVVLNRNRSYAISRGGFEIRIPGMTEFLVSLCDRYLSNKIHTAIIDGELMPWMAMGRSLIDDTFRTVELGLRKDIELLQKYGFNKQLDKISQARAHAPASLQKVHIKQIGQGNYQTFMAYDNFLPEWIGIEAMDRGLQIYSEQLALFAKEGPLEFKPFALLKVIDDEGHVLKDRVIDYDTSVNFAGISDDPFALISVDDLAEATAYYEAITKDLRMEGIVVKPDVVNAKVVPYMKVRNSNYLTLIYGPTYQEPKRLASLIKRKRVTEKQRLSRLQYEISQELLKIPSDQISPSNSHYRNLVATFLKTNDEESKVDPRL